MNIAVHSLLLATVSAVGWLAAGVVLSAYALMMSGRIAADGIVYLAANATGSAGLALSTIAAHAWQSAVVNVLWLAFGAAPLLRLVRRRLRVATYRAAQCSSRPAGAPMTPDGQQHAAVGVARS